MYIFFFHSSVMSLQHRAISTFHLRGGCSSIICGFWGTPRISRGHHFTDKAQLHNSCFSDKSVLMRQVQVKPVIQVSMSELSSNSGMYKTKHWCTCSLAPAESKNTPTESKSESLSIKAASSLSFCSQSSQIQG